MRSKLPFSAAVLALALLATPAFSATKAEPGAKPPASSQAKAARKAPKAKPARKTAAKKTAAKASVAKKTAEPQKPGPLADFGAVQAPSDVVHVANWVSYTHNARKKAFVLIDKKEAQLYVFDPKGKLRSRTPILLGKAVGDQTAPGVGNKPFSQIKEDEKTTPAGRFLARPGKNNRGVDIIWIDYNAAVSMHRMRSAKAEENRGDRMATADASDNRISYGCVNVPPGFYNKVLKPTVVRNGAYVYVLPETRTPQQQFGSFDVPAGGAAKG